MRICDPISNPILLASSICFFGGGVSAPKQKKQKAPTPPTINYSMPTPAPLPPIPEPTKPDPVPTRSDLDVQQAEDQQRADTAKRKGLRKTLLAGDANQASSSPVTGRTLLG